MSLGKSAIQLSFSGCMLSLLLEKKRESAPNIIG